MKYAVITLSGKQFKVSEGDQFTVDRLDVEVGKQLNADSVLLVSNDDKVTVGTPNVDGVTVSLEVLSEEKAPKIRVATYTAKSRSRKVHGHRQYTSTVKVVSIK
jgi:large subunit ribosomal protein L21